MAKFTKKVEFNAYQFNPEELKGLGDYEVEDLIIEALAIPDGVKDAFVADDGKLIVVLYTYGQENTKAYFELVPGEWLINDGMFAVIPDDEFREVATPAN